MLYIIFAVLGALALGTNAFKQKDPVNVLMNTIGPQNNPSERYEFYSFNICRPDKIQEKEDTLGERISGDRKVHSAYSINFASPKKNGKLCEQKLTKEELQKLRDAITQNYTYDIYIEQLPIQHKLGVVKYSKIYLFNHLDLTAKYNEALGTIISVEKNTESDLRMVDITNNVDGKITFTYSINWKATDETVPTLSNSSHFEMNETSWLFLLNTFLFSSMLVFILQKILDKADKAAGLNVDLEAERKDDDEESKWKLIRIEVFEPPQNIQFLSVFVGSGAHLLLTATFLSVLGNIDFFKERGSTINFGIVLYGITSIISGALSSHLYKYLGGNKWAWNIIISVTIFPLSFFVVAIFLNWVSWTNQSIPAVPFSGLLFIIMVLSFTGVPLAIFGGIMGRIKTEQTLSVNKFPKKIRSAPVYPWYMNPWFTIIVASAILFGTLQFELFYLFEAIWSKVGIVRYPAILTTLISVASITSSVSVIITYHQLNMMDYRWWWRSFFYGAASGALVLIYSIYYYAFRSQMFGFLQATYFFAYSALVAIVAALILGSVSFVSSLSFVRYIYTRVKKD